MKPTLQAIIEASRSSHPERPYPDGGIPHGTPVLTLEGVLPVEFLVTGDRIITRNQGSARLVARRVHRVRCPAVLVQAGSLGDTQPETDCLLPASQRVLIRDWRAKALFGQPQAVAAAGTLVDDEFVLDLGMMDLHVHVLTFERDQIVYAGGLELVSGPERQQVRHVA